MIRALSAWHPAASIVTIAPAGSRVRSRSGVAATSFDPSATATWPRTSRFSDAQAVTRWSRPVAVSAGADRADFPSMAIGISPVDSRAARTHRPNGAANAVGSSVANPRANVSGLGMPFARGRSSRRNDSWDRPYAATSSPVSAPAMTPRGAIVRMSARVWRVFVVSRRGGGQVREHGGERQCGPGASSGCLWWSRKPLPGHGFIAAR